MATLAQAAWAEITGNVARWSITTKVLGIIVVLQALAAWWQLGHGALLFVAFVWSCSWAGVLGAAAVRDTHIFPKPPGRPRWSSGGAGRG